MTFTCLGLMLIGSALFMGRAVLIATGLLKGPVLRACRPYRDDVLYFGVLWQLVLGIGLCLIFSGLVLSQVMQRIYYPFTVVGFLLVLITLALLRYPSLNLYLRYPRWYFDLLERTSRIERRRIAYMWMRLPLKAKIFYNSSDRSFLQWADFIIISTFF